MNTNAQPQQPDTPEDNNSQRGELKSMLVSEWKQVLSIDHGDPDAASKAQKFGELLEDSGFLDGNIPEKLGVEEAFAADQEIDIPLTQISPDGVIGFQIKGLKVSGGAPLQTSIQAIYGMLLQKQEEEKQKTQEESAKTEQERAEQVNAMLTKFEQQYKNLSSGIDSLPPWEEAKAILSENSQELLGLNSPKISKIDERGNLFITPETLPENTDRENYSQQRERTLGSGYGVFTEEMYKEFNPDGEFDTDRAVFLEYGENPTRVPVAFGSGGNIHPENPKEDREHFVVRPFLTVNVFGNTLSSTSAATQEAANNVVETPSELQSVRSEYEKMTEGNYGHSKWSELMANMTPETTERIKGLKSPRLLSVDKLGKKITVIDGEYYMPDMSEFGATLGVDIDPETLDYPTIKRIYQENGFRLATPSEWGGETKWLGEGEVYHTSHTLLDTGDDPQEYKYGYIQAWEAKDPLKTTIIYKSDKFKLSHVDKMPRRCVDIEW
ncbi:MAG: hypothetical protein ABII07_05270 [Patescibacteria group bacterium]